MARRTPAAEHDVTVGLIRGLLADQHPDLVELDLTLVANGWDNAIFRLGPHFSVRAPRRQAAADLVRNEQRWLPVLAPRLPLPITVAVRVGTPGRGYPWWWSVTPWFPGEVAADSTLADPRQDARRLGAFLAALHQPAVPDAPENRFRGKPLATLDGRLASNVAAVERSATLSGLVDVGAIRARWAELRDAQAWSGHPVWLHGDLHAANIIVTGGAISAVIDFGDVTSGDPAVDLAVGWQLFDPADRKAFREAAGDPDDHTWRRATAWALHFGVMYLLHSADNVRFREMGTRLLGTVLSKPYS